MHPKHMVSNLRFMRPVPGLHRRSRSSSLEREDLRQIICLVDAPNAEAASTVNRDAHGLVAEAIRGVTRRRPTPGVERLLAERASLAWLRAAPQPKHREDARGLGLVCSEPRTQLDEPTPELIALFSCHLCRLDGEGRSSDLDRDSRVLLEVVIPVRILWGSALGRRDDHVVPVR